MKKSLALASLFISFSVLSTANALGPEILKKEYRCSDQKEYTVYITQTTGITTSFAVKAFCSTAAGSSVASCTAEDTAAARACFSEFKRLNAQALAAGDHNLVIVQGR